jgi:hypothetical protein
MGTQTWNQWNKPKWHVESYNVFFLGQGHKEDGEDEIKWWKN